MTQKEKFLQQVKKEDKQTTKAIRTRVAQRDMLRESQNIALKILCRLDELAWSQKKLAEKMGVSPQQISKIVSGKENLTIETQIRLQRILKLPILASFFDNYPQTKTTRKQPS